MKTFNIPSASSRVCYEFRKWPKLFDDFPIYFVISSASSWIIKRYRARPDKPGCTLSDNKTNSLCFSSRRSCHHHFCTIPSYLFPRFWSCLSNTFILVVLYYHVQSFFWLWYAPQTDWKVRDHSFIHFFLVNTIIYQDLYIPLRVPFNPMEKYEHINKQLSKSPSFSGRWANHRQPTSQGTASDIATWAEEIPVAG